MDKFIRKVFSAGQQIFAEGETQDFAYIIEEGEVEIWTIIENEKRVLNLLEAGTLFGELALVDRQPRSASATAKTETLLTVVTQRQVDERISDADPILRMLIYVVMRHFRSEVERSRARYSPNYTADRYTKAAAVADAKITEAINMIKMESELQLAMDKEQFRLVYQPIYNLLSGEITGVEALIRWKSPTRGEIRPDQFIPLAEATSLILPIGNWVISSGLKDFLKFRDSAKKELSMSFNLARRQLESEAFLPFLTEEVFSNGISPDYIKLEMLERNLFQSDHVLTWIKDCSSRGFSILLDDFGTGYSSLQYLQEYQPAALKIDRSFVSGLGVRQESDRICQAIIQLAFALSIDVIAEGVETAEQAKILKEMGCKFAQGFLFAKPMPAGELLTKLAV